MAETESITPTTIESTHEAAEILAMAEKRMAAIEKPMYAYIDEFKALRTMLGIIGPDPSPDAPAETPAPQRDGADPSSDGNTASSNGNGQTRRGRPAGTGQRAQQALALLKENGPMRIPELADKMGIKQNYLYRVMPKLDEENKVTKLDDGRYALPVAA